MERFWNKVMKIVETDECWEWIAFKNKDGYGLFGYNGKNQKAHRVSWQLHNGPIPDGLCVLHKCDNPSCVNPNHLFLGTNADNIKDRVNKNRTVGKHGRKTYIITFPDGHEDVLHNMNKFCREKGLNDNHMVQVAKGKRKQHKGFKARYV